MNFFDELCEDLWDQAPTPIKNVLTHPGMKIGDIYVVELIGGANRVPKLQAKLQAFLGWSELDKHLDADEAIVLVKRMRKMPIKVKGQFFCCFWQLIAKISYKLKRTGFYHPSSAYLHRGCLHDEEKLGAGSFVRLPAMWRSGITRCPCPG